MAGHPSGLPLGHGGQAAQKVQDESNMMGRTGSAGGGGHGRLATWPPGHPATLPPGHQATQLRVSRPSLECPGRPGRAWQGHLWIRPRTVGSQII